MENVQGWDSLSWVFGGIVVVLTLSLGILQWWKYISAKIEQRTTEKNKLTAYWSITDHHTETLNALSKSSEINSEILKELCEQRKARLPREIVKSDSIKVLLDIHKEDHAECNEFYHELDMLDKKDRRQSAQAGIEFKS